MYFTGFADEASVSPDVQIKVTKELGWQNIEAREVKVEGFPKGLIHDISDKAFERLVEKLEAAGLRINCFGSAIASYGKKMMTPWIKVILEFRFRIVLKSKTLTAFGLYT